jgi:RNA polymerase sigma factor for flagellar operon FliA
VDVHRAIMISIDAEKGAEGTSLDLPDTGESPERALLRGERARYLHDAIRALPDRLDEVVERNFFGDESLTDIAEDLGVTLSRVSQMRARALTLLHAAMSELWEGRSVPADGGVRARNQQKSYVDRVAGRAPSTPLPHARASWPDRSGRRGEKACRSTQVPTAPRRNQKGDTERPAARMQRDSQ